MAWLRHDDQRCLNRKIGQLTDVEYRALDGLHEYCARARNGGNFARTDLHFALYVTPRGPRHVTQKHLNSFVKHGLVDLTEEGFKVHDWDVYQPKDPTAAERMQRHRDRNADRNGTVTDAVTPASPDRDSRARGPSRPVPNTKTPSPNPAVDVADPEDASRRELVEAIAAGQADVLRDLNTL